MLPHINHTLIYTNLHSRHTLISHISHTLTTYIPTLHIYTTLLMQQILLLDEATSSLDAESESKVRHNLSLVLIPYITPLLYY